jgi:hypothetical protein
MFTGRTVLLAVGMVAASVWVGSLVSLVVVSAVARRTLDARSRVVLFRGVGRSYQYVGTGSLLVATAAGLVLAWPLSDVERGVRVEFLLSGLLLLVSVVGMTQAKRMTVLRRLALDHPDQSAAVASVQAGATVALVLRGAIAIVTLAMVILGADLLAW